jgi:hypothetical protein
MSDIITCRRCQCKWYKSYLKEKNLYWCQMCSTMHLFTPFEIKDFAPFSSMEEATAFQTKMRKQLETLANSSYFYEK